MIKIVGIALIVIASSKIGFVFASRLDKRRKNLIDFKDALSFIEGEISFGKSSPAQAFLNFSNCRKGMVSDFFLYMYKRLSEDKLTVSGACENAFGKYEWKMCITKEDVKILTDFFARLGKSDAKNEMKNIYNTTVKLNGQIGAAQNECDTSCKMYKSGGILVGMLIAVLLA